MNAHSTSPASVALPGVDAGGEPPGWLSAQVNHLAEPSTSCARGLPAGTDALAALDRPVAPSEDATTALRSRLLRMIVANEQLRKSQAAVSGPGE